MKLKKESSSGKNSKPTLPTEKARLRKKILGKRNNIPPRIRAEKSRLITARLERWDDYVSARSALFFVPTAGEPDMSPLIRKELSARGGSARKIFAPRVDGRSISAVRIRDFDKDLAPGVFGILEPARSRPASPAAFDVVIVPALAYDNTGGRLGRGGGYYDRFLRNVVRRKTVGIVFDEFLIARVPRSRLDERVDAVITDKRTLETPKKTYIGNKRRQI